MGPSAPSLRTLAAGALCAALVAGASAAGAGDGPGGIPEAERVDPETSLAAALPSVPAVPEPPGPAAPSAVPPTGLVASEPLPPLRLPETAPVTGAPLLEPALEPWAWAPPGTVPTMAPRGPSRSPFGTAGSVQRLPFEPLVRRYLPQPLQRRLRSAWRHWAPPVHERLVDALASLPPSWRRRVDALRGWAAHPVGRQVGLAVVAGCLALLTAIRLWRRGDVVVAIEYPTDLRGCFSVRLARRRSDAQPTPRRRRALWRRASTRTWHHLVARETHFRGVEPGRYWISVEGELRDADSDAVQREPFEVRSVTLHPRRTERVEFDLRPTLCPLTIVITWSRRAVKEASVALRGQPQTLRYARGGRTRLDAPLGRQRIAVGSDDRVAVCEVEIGDLRPRSVEIDLAGSDVLFRGCPAAVTPYMRGDLSGAARALEREGQTELARRLQARLHEHSGQTTRAAALYRESGDWDSAVRVLQQVTPDDPTYAEACVSLADCFEAEGRPAEAAARLEQALAADGESARRPELYSRLAGVLEQCDEITRAVAWLERLRDEAPEHPDLNTRIERLRKRLSGEEHTSGARAAEPWPGGSRYEILGQIGAGGMGVVFRVRDLRLGREVALKRLTQRLSDHPAAMEMFRREARAAAALNHPNIVTIFDADEEHGHFFITMELLAGESLSALLRRRGRLAARDVVMLGRQVAAGLEYAHGQGIVHRDIKPGNLFFTREKVLKIMDFGLAKMAEEVRRQTTSVAGTPFYMAPEQSGGAPVGPPADIYSLGITLFELVTGRVPFREGDVAHRHRHTPPPDPRALATDAPTALSELILALLGKRPGERPEASALRERLDELARAQRGE